MGVWGELKMATGELVIMKRIVPLATRKSSIFVVQWFLNTVPND